jgi:hypothetical protein
VERSEIDTRPGGRLGRRRRRGRLLAATLVFASLAALSAPAARAVDDPNAPAPPGSGQVLESWGLAPTGTDPNQPSSRPTLTYELSPGTTIQDSVTLWNFSDVALDFHIYGTDAYNNRTGQFTLLSGDQKPTDAGSWVTLGTNNLTVAARTKVDIPVTLKVPLEVSPGDHSAGIVASVPTPVAQNGQRIVLDRRTGTRLYVRVSGPVNPELRVENVSSDYHGAFNPLDGSMDVSYTVRNPGNVRLGAKPVLTVSGPFGSAVKTVKLEPIPELLPKNSVTYHVKVSGVPALFRDTANVELNPIGAGGVKTRSLPPASASSTTWAIPWTLLLVIVLAYLLFRIYRRWRRQSVPPPRSRGGSAGPGSPSRPGSPGRRPVAAPTNPNGRPRERV